MIDFACKRFDLDEVLRCSFNLTKTEFNILKYLMKYSGKSFTSQEISKIFKIGLSTSQRAIKKIYDKELIKKSQRNLKKGGYILVYSVKENLILKQKFLKIIHAWVKKVEDKVQKW